MLITGGFRFSWLSAMSTVAICLTVIIGAQHAKLSHHSTELNRVDSVKMGSYLCNTLLTTSKSHAIDNKYPVYIAPNVTQDKKIHVQDCETLLLNILYFSIVHNKPPCCQLAFYGLQEQYH
jgi:hypothetical protein